MPKDYTTMTRMERRFHDVCRHVCLPNHQLEIYNELLNAVERRIIEGGTKEDIEKKELLRRMNGLAPLQPREDFDWLIGNGESNILRIAEYRSISPQRLALEFALPLRLLQNAEYRRMLKEFLGDEASISGVSIEFRDNVLWVDGTEDAKFRPTKASRDDHIVRTFEETAWRQQSVDFASRFHNRRALRDCIANLNRKTSRVKFTLVGDMSVAWSLVDASQEKQ